MPQPRIRRSPRLSVNALAAYMTASAAGRERILLDQKYPKAYRTGWYREALSTIVKFLLDPERDEEVLIRAVDRLNHAPGPNRTEAQRLQNNAEALQRFMSLRDPLDFDDLDAGRGRDDHAHLAIESVRISVLTSR